MAHRTPLRWPDGARVALCVIVNLEHYEWDLSKIKTRPQSMPGFRAPLPYPDMRNFSQREYGNRVGIFRIMDLLDKHGIPATVAMDAAVAANYPLPHRAVPPARLGVHRARPDRHPPHHQRYDGG